MLSKYHLDAAARQERKDFLELSPEDERSVGRLRELSGAFPQELAERFYAHLLSHPGTARRLGDEQLLAQLKAAQLDYFQGLVSGQYGEDYFESRLRIGEIHYQVGLDPKWYLGAYCKYLQLTLPHFAKQAGGEIPTELLALLKVVFLDMDLAIHTYVEAATERTRRQNEELRHAVDMYFQAELRAQQYAKLTGHEIRGALQSISAVCESVAEDYADRLPPEAVDALTRAHQRCLKTHEVVESILSQPERAGERTWVDARQLVAEVAARTGAYGDGRDVDFVGLQEPVRVWADPIGLREVFANLVGNAVHHGDKSPTRIRVFYVPQPAEHVFCVSDNGPGVAPAEHARIFEPFVRAPRGGGGDRRHQGRGLGLHFVRTIIEQHGGRVWVESELGRGSKFFFSLPKAGGESGQNR